MFAVFGPVILAALLVVHGGVIAVGDGEGGRKRAPGTTRSSRWVFNNSRGYPPKYGHSNPDNIT